MAKWSRAPGQFLGGQWVEHKAEIWPFFFQILEILLFFNFPKIWANVEFIPINLIIFKAPPVQIWSSYCAGLTYFPPPSHCAIFIILTP
jgi:hypothetical protein